MKNRIRNLIIASVAVVILVGALLAVLFLLPEKDDDTSSDTSESETVELVKKNTDSKGDYIDNPIKKVVIKNETEYEISLNKDKQLCVKGFEDLPINDSQLDLLSSNLSSLTAERKLTEDSSNAADFGLDKPRATAEVTYHDDSVLKFELGNDAPGDAGVYLRIEENGPIYLVSSSFGEYLLEKPEAYIGTTLITAPAVKEDENSDSSNSGSNDTPVLRSIKLTGSVRNNSPFVISVNENMNNKDWFSAYTYLVTSPIKKGVREKFSETAQSLTSLYAIEAVKAHPTADDLKKYGLDKPYSVAELTLAVQSIKSGDNDETITTYYNSTKHTVKLGNKDKDGNYYALVNDIKAVYLVSSGSVPWAELNYNDVASELLFLRDITTMKAVELEIGGNKTRFDLTHYPDEDDRDKNMKVEIGGKQYSTDIFRDFYQVLMSLKRFGDSDKSPGGNPEVVIRLIPEKESDTITAKFYKKTASTYHCEMSDGDKFAVKASDIDKLKIALNYYLQGKEIPEVF
ncbi:MAG TPA: DUF4340 domain-containing protein [Candidatus Avimonas sp.]|nr:DUF4340 domain-containing protein [Candidatus Avimonas sp.]